MGEWGFEPSSLHKSESRQCQCDTRCLAKQRWFKKKSLTISFFFYLFLKTEMIWAMFSMQWLNLLKSMLMEADWVRDKYIPTMNCTYMKFNRIKSYDNIFLYYNTIFVNISNFLVYSCKRSVIICNPYVIYCNQWPRQLITTFFFSFFFFKG